MAGNRSFQYDGNGNVVSDSEAVGQNRQYAYTAFNKVESVTSAGKLTLRLLDGLNRPAAAVWPLKNLRRNWPASDLRLSTVPMCLYSYGWSVFG